jgi:hypothetical protein
MKADIEKANQEAASRIVNGKPTLVNIASAGDVVPGMKKNLVLHAGPPITWDRMCGPMRGAVIGGLIYEGLAQNREEAEELSASGDIIFDPCHHHNAVGPMAGVVTYSMPVWVVENRVFGNRGYCTLNEGLGKVLRYGAFSDDVVTRLKWMETELANILRKALEKHGEIDMRKTLSPKRSRWVMSVTIETGLQPHFLSGSSHLIWSCWTRTKKRFLRFSPSCIPMITSS